MCVCVMLHFSKSHYCKRDHWSQRTSSHANIQKISCCASENVRSGCVKSCCGHRLWKSGGRREARLADPRSPSGAQSTRESSLRATATRRALFTQRCALFKILNGKLQRFEFSTCSLICAGVWHTVHCTIEDMNLC